MFIKTNVQNYNSPKIYYYICLNALKAGFWTADFNSIGYCICNCYQT